MDTKQESLQYVLDRDTDILIIDDVYYNKEDILPTDWSMICTYSSKPKCNICRIKTPNHSLRLIVCKDDEQSLIYSFDGSSTETNNIDYALRMFIQTHRMDTVEGLREYIKLFKRIVEYIDNIITVILQ